MDQNNWLWHQRLRSWILSGAAAALVFYGLALPVEWVRHRINAKIAADERIAAALERIASVLVPQSTFPASELREPGL